MIKNKSLLVPLLFVAGLVVVTACGDDAPAPNNGVNDVRKACEIRTGWSKLSAQECIDCLSIAPTPKCDCPAFQQEFAAKCADQGAALGNERNCDLVGECVGKCAKTDCGCIDACYDDRAACRPKAAALDGCTTDVCDKYCR
jgi:hypothetical protein